MKTYEVNADNNRTFTGNARDVAEVAVSWQKAGYRPAAYAITTGPTGIETHEVAISTVRETARQLAHHP